MPENSEGYTIEPQITSNDEVEKPKTLESHKVDRIRKLEGARGKLAALGLGIVTGFVGSQIMSDNSSNEALAFEQVNNPPATDTISNLFETNHERKETKLENYVEKKHGIEILDFREAYTRLGISFDIYDEGQFGNHPPTRWTPEQIALLDESISRLPEKFHKYLPDDEKVMFTLTDYGEDCPCGGTYHEHVPEYWPAVVMLDDVGFRKDKGEWPFGILTHELTHGVNADEYDHTLGPRATKIVGFDEFEEARVHFKPILDKKYEDGLISADNYYRLDYGFMGINYDGLNHPGEFIAVLAETYIKGEVKFMELKHVFGEENTQALYEFLKNDLFDGQESFERKVTVDEILNQFVDKKLVAEEIEELKKEYGINFIDTSEKGMLTEDVDTLSEVLDIFPDYLLEELESSGEFTIVLTDSNVNKVRHNGYVVNLPRESLEKVRGTYEYQLAAVRIIGHELTHRANELKGFEPQEKLIELLGGDEFLQNPEKLFPKIFEKDENGKYKNDYMLTEDGALINPEEMIAIFAERYLGGDERFREIRYLFDPEDLYKIYSGKKLMRMEKKALGYQIYNLIRDEIFSGREYEGNYGFVPKYKNRA